MRDNALAKELCAMGHDAVLLPLYLPLTLDEPAASPDVPVFFGGLNVYLQQRFAWFRNAPRWVDRLVDHPRLLKWLGRFSGMTQGAEIGELTLSMLRGEEGAQGREIEKLIDWIRQGDRPDVIWLSTALLAGVARRIQAALGIPVLCSLQGEDSFLDGLPEPSRAACWREMGLRLRESAGCVAPSAYFGDLMMQRLHMHGGFVRVIPNGIGLEGLEPADAPSSARAPVLGFLSRLSAGKGLGTVVEAFIALRARGRFPEARLVCVGTMTEEDTRYVDAQKNRLRAAGLESSAEFRPRVSREEKIAFLREIDVLSVPAHYGEAFGLYLLEAMACGVPVVQPRTAAFPEIVESTGGGVLYDPAGGAAALADAVEALFSEPGTIRDLGRRGHDSVRREYSMRRMAERFLAYAREVCPS
jgi:glycosyltransferase involved in cell wall biosynthesis